ncbi:MAG: DUF4861 domain-containing protein [Opitutaceae bacterium]|jgi:hypothetical protein|nr:DUF4861 domain-containing protein [Opitutaceae bacterium]
MKRTTLPASVFALQFALVFTAILPAAPAAGKFTVTVSHDLAAARPSETIVIPFAEVSRRLPGLLFDQVVVRDAGGAVVPSQATAFHHVHRGAPVYQELVFQHDFAAGEKSAVFTIEASPVPAPPVPARVMARYVPERHDDFAWENDRMAHRIYGPGLELAAAGPDQMTSSGIDFWCKKVRHFVVDNWYHKGHDGLHTDTGEGLDMYDVGTYRGLGGTGVWDGSALRTSRNWSTWKILAGGPLRAVFELGYEPWDAAPAFGITNGFMVSETKRFTVDPGLNVDRVESTFTFQPPRKSPNGEITVAIGLSKHPSKTTASAPTQNETGAWLSLWEVFKDPADGKLGTGIVLDPSAKFAGFAETATDLLIFAKVKSGEPLRYHIGGGWDLGGDFKTRADWENYLASVAARLRNPVRVAFAGENADGK